MQNLSCSPCGAQWDLIHYVSLSSSSFRFLSLLCASELLNLAQITPQPPMPCTMHALASCPRSQARARLDERGLDSRSQCHMCCPCPEPEELGLEAIGATLAPKSKQVSSSAPIQHALTSLRAA